MIRRIIFLSFLTLFFNSCGGNKRTAISESSYLHRAHIPEKPNHRTAPHRNNTRTKREDTNPRNTDHSRQAIIDYAKTFEGTRYKFGGTTSAGMDCSGLICVAFQRENISLPRISRDMAQKGVPVALSEIEEGDLVFFKTNGTKAISHVGLVVETEGGEVKFIHSTTRAGVIISSLSETYWKKAFAEVRRII